LCLHSQSPTHLSTQIPSQEESIEELMRSCPMEPLLADALPTAALPSYVADSDPDEEPEEDPKEDHADYPADGGDGNDEPSDDDDIDDEDEEPFEDEEDDEAWKTVILKPAMSASMEVCIARHVVALPPSLPVSSPPLPLPSPLTTSPTDAGAPLGYRAAGIRMRAFLPSTSRKTDVPNADMLPRKRACLTTPTLRFEVGESSVAGAARQPAPTTLEGVNQGVTDLDTTVRQRTEEFKVRFEEAHDSQALLRARVNTVFRDRPFHCSTVLLLDIEVTYARETWAGSKERSATIEAHVRTLEVQVTTLIAQTLSLQTQLTTSLGRIEILEARDLEPQEGPVKAGSSCVATALAERDEDRSRDGDNSHGLGTDGRRQVPTQRECTYTDFLKCQSMNFKGTDGVIGLTQWVEKMESVFLISVAAALAERDEDKSRDGDNSHGLGTDGRRQVPTQRECTYTDFLKCQSMNFKVERYVGGLPNMIHGSVKTSKPPSMQEAIEFSTKMMDKKMLTVAKRQA
nr:hypothetical protein [Tanacetum cinerariifolium]